MIELAVILAALVLYTFICVVLADHVASGGTIPVVTPTWFWLRDGFERLIKKVFRIT